MLGNDCVMDPSSNATHDHIPLEEVIHADSLAVIDNGQIVFRHDSGTIQSPPMDLDSLEFEPAPKLNDRSWSFGSGSAASLLQQSMSLPFASMGGDQYGDLLDQSLYRKCYPDMPLQRTNSLFSDHISAIEYLLHQNWIKQCPTTFQPRQFMESVQYMLSTFVLISWQRMTAWHTYTKADVPLKELTAWRATQTREAYERITPTYRPTKLQITTRHPAVIDWVPWGSLRDKLIQYHSANPCLDELICDIGKSYVVPVDLSRLVAGVPPTAGYVCVWDLVCAIAPDADSHSSTSPERFAYDADAIRNTFSDDNDVYASDEKYFGERPTLPAFDAHTFFNSKSLAVQAFKAIGMDKGAATFRLDPEFFHRHPELYDSRDKLMAIGIPLRSNSHCSMPATGDLDAGVVGRYKEMSKWTVDRNTLV